MFLTEVGSPSKPRATNEMRLGVGEVDGEASARRRRGEGGSRKLPPPKHYRSTDDWPSGGLAASESDTSVGLGAGETRWRRTEEFIARSPGCRQGTILAPVGVAATARQQDRFGLGTFWFEDATRGSRRGHVGSDAAQGGAA